MKTTPLPKYDPIALENVPDCSTLLFYGGSWVTEWFGNHIRKHPYNPPAYHAAFYIEQGLFLNVGKFKVVQDIGWEYKSNRRIDVISYKYIRKDQIEPLKRVAYLDTSKPKVGLSLPDYDIWGFLGHGIRELTGKIPLLKKLPMQSKKKDFCNENVIQIFATQKIKTSYKLDYKSAPWDLFDYALANPDECKIRTLWTGGHFKD